VLTVYAYDKCSSCRDAIKWLNAHRVSHQVKAIRETPPSPSELANALKLLGGDIRKLFNTSGMDYRALGMKEKLPVMSDDEAISLLTQNGNLVKRPLVIGNAVALAGFKPDIWKRALL
jgi:arsenate reductase